MICTWMSPVVSFFLWHLTWGWRQLFCHIIFFWFFLSVVIPLSWIRSFIYSLFFHTVTTIILSFSIGLLLTYGCFIPIEDIKSYSTVYTDIQKTTLSFALGYNLCLYVVILLLKNLFPLPMGRLIVVLFLSGITSALIVPRFIFFT